MKSYEILHGRWIIRALFQEGGIWYGRVRDTATGKVRRHSTRQTDKRKAKQAIIDWVETLRDQQADLYSPPFAEAFSSWLELKAVRPSTKADLEWAQKIYAREFSGYSVDAIQPLQVEKFLAGFVERKRAARTRNKHLGTLRSFFRWACRQGYCPRDPTDGIARLRGPAFKAMALTHDQARALLAEAAKPHEYQVHDKRGRSYAAERKAQPYLYLAILISLYTGLRRSNVLGLKWRHVDLGEGRIAIPGAEMKGHKDHSIPIHPALKVVVEDRLRRRRRVPLAEDLVLGDPPQCMRNAFLGCCARAGLNPAPRWHDLRHTFASWLDATEPFSVVQRLLGHRINVVTWDYVHHEWQRLVAAVGRLPDFVGENGALKKREKK